MGTFSRLCDLFKYWTMWQYLGKRALGVLQWKTNRKSYIAYRMACIPTTFSDLAGSGLHYSVDLRIQTYTKPVPLNYGKLATEYAWIYGYFFCSVHCVLLCTNRSFEIVVAGRCWDHIRRHSSATTCWRHHVTSAPGETGHVTHTAHPSDDTPSPWRHFTDTHSSSSTCTPRPQCYQPFKKVT